MLNFMRKNAKSWLIKVLLLGIVVVFVAFYGFSDRGTIEETVLASVGEKKITIAEYQEVYKNLLQFYRNIYQNQISEDLIKQMGLKQKALENLIDREILLQEARRTEIHAQPDEIRKAIMQSPVFQENGTFSQRNYERTLRYYGISPADFERSQEQEIIIKKLETMVQSAVKVSEQEIKDLFLLENEKVKLEYVCFTADTMKETPPISPQEIEDYYKKQAEDFRVPEKVKAKYILFSPPDYESKASISPEDLKEYYKMDTERFSEPKKVQARHILLKVDKDTPAEKEQEIKKRAEEILEKLKKGEDFSTLAEHYSEDPGSAKNGGELGYFKNGDMTKPFEEAAFALKPGELSDPVKTGYGFHIIRIDDVKEAHIKPFDEVKTILEKELKQEEAKKIAREEAHRAYNRLFKSKDIEGYAKQNSLTLSTTDYFTYGSGPEDSAEKSQFSEVAFPLSPGDLSPAFAVGQKYALLKLEDKKASHIPPIEEVKETITDILEKEKKETLAKQQAEEMISRLQAGGDWVSLAKENNVEIKTSQEFTRRGEFIPEIGKAPALKEAAFALSAEKPYANTVVQTEQGSFVVKFLERIVPGEDEYQKQQERLEKQLMQTKKEEVFNHYLDSLKAKTEIKVDRKLIALD